MAKDLKTLIRLHDWEVDEKRRHLNDIMKMLYEMEDKSKELELEIIREQKLAAEEPELAGFGYGNYAKATIERRDVIAQSIELLETEAEKSRELVREAYLELKKYEVVQKNRKEEEARELSRKEQIEQDEVGLQGYLQRGS